MKTIILTLAILVSSCSTTQKSSGPSKEKNYFAGMRGCFLLYNLKTNQFESTIGDLCNERLPAASSFKVPLAVMAFDSGVLKHEKQMLKWDGGQKMLDAWEKDHNAETWMRDSVVWFSQRLTPKMGQRKFQKYLKDFDYGNQDISTGLTTAWLNSPNNPNGALKISAYEQIDFLKKLWTNTLPVSKRSMELTRKMTYLETSPKGFRLSGKTGSNFWDAAKKVRMGWFIAHLSNGEKEYLVVTNMSDLMPVETTVFGGAQSKMIMKEILSDKSLW